MQDRGEDRNTPYVEAHAEPIEQHADECILPKRKPHPLAKQREAALQLRWAQHETRVYGSVGAQRFAEPRLLPVDLGSDRIAQLGLARGAATEVLLQARAASRRGLEVSFEIDAALRRGVEVPSEEVAAFRRFLEVVGQLGAT